MEKIPLSKVMKLCSVFLLAFSLHISANVYSQQSKVSLDLSDVTMEKFIEALKEQTGIHFFYNASLFENTPRVSVSVKGTPLSEVLAETLGKAGFIADYRDEVVVIRKASEQQEVPNPQTVKGKVTDDKGYPLPGVTVLIKGTGMGVVTDAEGNYTIQLPETKDIRLLFTFIGMRTEEVAYAGQKEVNVTMHDEATQMDEVVITGYQVIDRRKSTSAVTSVRAEDINIPGVSSIDKMLEGQIPDMMLMTNSGEVGIVPRIRIRGTSTLVGNREPLWVVDGIIVQDPVPVSPEELNDPDYINRIGNAIAGLNPQDIERLDVLKDAAATAIYGAKAANGVIVITTKKGRVGRPIVQYNMTTTMRQRPRYTDRKINLMDSRERVQLSRELVSQHYEMPQNMAEVGYEYLLSQLWSGAINQTEFDREVGRLETMNTDWFDLLTKDSFSHQHTVSVSGGSQDARYYASVGYTKDNDVIKSNATERYTAALNLDVNMTRWLTASFSLNGNVSSRDYYQDEIAPMNYAYKTSRVIPAYTEDGEYAFYQKKLTYQEGYNYNVLNELANSSYEQNTSAFTANVNLQFKFTDWLNANAIVSYNTSSAVIEGYWGEETYHAASLRKSEFGVPAPKGEGAGINSSVMPFGGELTRDETTNNSYTVRLQLNGNKYFGADEQHNINASLGYEMSSSKYKGYRNVTRGYYPDRGRTFVGDVNLDDYPAYKGWLAGNVPTIMDNLTNLVSGYVTVSYSYQNHFTLNANARIDGSNKFGDRSNEKLLPIWSASASWNLSELPALRRDWIDMIALKTSFGYQGNMLSDQYPVMIIRKLPTSSYFGEQTAEVVGHPNPDLKWEKTTSYNAGLEFSLFERRLMMEGSYYFKRTKDAFMSRTISSVNGVEGNSYVINRGDVDNSGYSVSLTVAPIRTKDWRWTLSTSFSKTINKLKADPDADEYALQDYLNGTALVEGQAVGTFYSYKYLGLSPVDGGPMFDDMREEKEKLDGLSKYDTYTRVLTPSGKRDPFMSGSINTTLRYKNWRLNASLAYSLGAKVRLFSLYSKSGGDTSVDASSIRPENNADRVLADRWRRPGDERHTNIPAIITKTQYDAWSKYQHHWANGDDTRFQPIANNYWEMFDYGNHRVVSANYLKCSNISLTYQFGENILQKAGMSRLELSLSAANLFTICSKKLNGQTPTQAGFANIQLSDRPTYSLGLSVAF